MRRPARTIPGASAVYNCMWIVPSFASGPGFLVVFAVVAKVV